MMANQKNGTLYVGVTSNVLACVYQHRTSMVQGFTQRYGCKMLVWYEEHPNMESAIIRERQLKSWNRTRKLALIEADNPDWSDLYNLLFENQLLTP